jgi:DNA-binding transcriptional LysR family regulator
MGLSASAAAKLISRLELRLGVGLINRTTSVWHLPAKGQIFLERAREILGAIDAAELRQPASGKAEKQSHRQRPRAKAEGGMDV